MEKRRRLRCNNHSLGGGGENRRLTVLFLCAAAPLSVAAGVYISARITENGRKQEKSPKYTRLSVECRSKIIFVTYQRRCVQKKESGIMLQ